MSRMVTRPQLRTLALRRADVEAETDEINGRFPTSEVNEEINRSIAVYHTMLVGLRGADYYEKKYWLLDPITKSNPAAPDVSLAGVPTYEMTTIIVTVTRGGTQNQAEFTISVNGSPLSPPIDPGAGTNITPIEIPGIGLSLNTASAGTYVVGDTYSTKTKQWQTTPNVSSYVLPADFFQLTIIESKISGVHVPLERFNRNQKPWLRDVNTWYGYDAIPMYRLRGDGRYKNTQLLEFSPTPAQAYDIDIWYIPQPAEFTTDATSDGGGVWELPFDSGGEEWVALDVAQKLLLKDNLDPSQLLARKAQVETILKDTFAFRDSAMPERVVDRTESFGLGPWPWR